MKYSPNIQQDQAKITHQGFTALSTRQQQNLVEEMLADVYQTAGESAFALNLLNVYLSDIINADFD